MVGKANVLLKAKLTKPDLSFKNQKGKKMIKSLISRQHTHYIFIYFFPFFFFLNHAIKTHKRLHNRGAI